VRAKLKPLSKQVIVITGASSGIGLTTARRAVREGARVVLAARNRDALADVARDLEHQGAEVAYVAADVSQRADVERIAQTAIERFGGFDTWVNNAGVSIYGRIEETPVDDMRQLFETDFWGVVHGSLAAVGHLKRRGGALINVGSVVSDRAVPLQGVYSASKHAVKGFTDALRMELEKQRAPVSVTLIKPAAIDTLYSEHAKNLLPNEPSLPPPVYAPETVAEAILHAAQHPVRDVFVGGGAKLMAAAAYFVPRLMDRYMNLTMFRAQQRGPRRRRRRDHNLYGPARDGRERSGQAVHVMERSAYTRAALHRPTTALTALGAIAIGALVWQRMHAGNARRAALRPYT